MEKTSPFTQTPDSATLTPQQLAEGEGAQLTPLQAREVLDFVAKEVGNPSPFLPKSYPALCEIEAEGVRAPFHRRLEMAQGHDPDARTLQVLAEDPSLAVRRALAGREDLPGEFQVTLAKDPQVAYTIAGRADLTPEAARTIFESGSCDLHLAQNPACPPEILEGLYGKNPEVAWVLAENPATPGELLHQIALREDSHWLLHDIAHHPNTTLSTLGHLADSAQPSVAEQARSVLAKRLEQEVECER